MPTNLRFGNNPPFTSTRTAPVYLGFPVKVEIPIADPIVITGYAPTVLVGIPEGTVTFTGLPPTTWIDLALKPAVGSVDFNGITPFVRLNQYFYPEAGSVSFTGLVPVVPTTIIVPLGTGTSFTGLAPSYQEGRRAQTVTGQVTFTGLEPTWIPTLNQRLTPVTAALTFNTYAPVFNGVSPVILANPQNVTVTEGAETGFTVIITGPNPLSYQWYETTAGLLVGETGPQLGLTYVTMEQNGNGYYCIADDGFGNVLTSTTATLTVLLDTALDHAGGNFPLKLMLSGGQGNMVTLASIGGPASKGIEGMVTSQSMNLTGDDTLTAVYAIGATNVALGLGTLDWDAGTGTLTFTDFNGGTSFVTAGAAGYYWTVGEGQVLLWVRGALPGSNTSVQYVVSDWQQNLFDDVAYSERSANHTNYRCLYLQNYITTPLAEVSVRVSMDPKYGLVHIATEYPSNAGVNAADAVYVEQNAIQKGGTLLLGARTEEAVADYIDFTFKGGPFNRPAYEKILSNNVSDGSTVQVASQLADENDSTNVLAGLSWGDTITWKNLPSGSFVSFWVRRNITAASSGSAQELDSFSMDIRYGRTY